MKEKGKYMEEMNFEETMEKLEQIANTLEKGDLSLEESLVKFHHTLLLLKILVTLQILVRLFHTLFLSLLLIPLLLLSVNLASLLLLLFF